MPELNSILTVMSPTGLVCGTLLDLKQDEMEFEMSAEFPVGFETDWRMELRGRPETAQGRMRVTTGRLNREGPGRYRAAILGVADRDRACFQAWLNSRNKTWVGMPVDVDDGFRPTTRMASTAETRAALRRMEERRAVLARAAAEREAASRPTSFVQPPRAGFAAPTSVPTVQARVVAQAPTVPAAPPSAVPPIVQARVVAPSTFAVPARPPVATPVMTAPPSMPPIMAEADDTLPRRKPAQPRDPNAFHRGVNLRIDDHEGQTRFVVRYVDRRRYSDDWSQNIQYGAIVLESPLAIEVGSAVDVVLITPDGRTVPLMGVVLSGTQRTTCVAVMLSDADNLALKP